MKFLILHIDTSRHCVFNCALVIFCIFACVFFLLSVLISFCFIFVDTVTVVVLIEEKVIPQYWPLYRRFCLFAYYVNFCLLKYCCQYYGIIHNCHTSEWFSCYYSDHFLHKECMYQFRIMSVLFHSFDVFELLILTFGFLF